MDPKEEIKEVKVGDKTVFVRLNCRFYEQKYPKEGDLVQVQVKDIVENGAYVFLIEYDNIEGLITPNEFSKQVNLKNAYRALKVGRTEIAKVLKVDEEKGYIDLSKKQVPLEEVQKFEDKVAKAKKVNSILRTVAEKCGINIDHLYDTIVWPLNRKGHAHDAFQTALSDPSSVFGELEVPAEIQEKLIAEIKRRLAPQPVTIRWDFELTCSSYEGIDAIKESLRAGERKSTEVIKLKATVIAAPLYKITTITHDKVNGIAIIREAVDAIEEVIKAHHGKIERKSEQPVVVGEKEEKHVMDEIQEHMEEVKEDSDEDENNDEDMGNIDVGVDTEEIDRQEEIKKSKKANDDDDEA
eukprot:TRINITY_DN2062_c0_g1_i1.p1 TRINITY_DN2062_c0_g1~~TRINITY_DN2062_c0_g1_i1.p1  ORF type:complete len:354 (-),score=134.84 TRINITY_DN2062_c0_g1_i1:171-1232(-)